MAELDTKPNFGIENTVNTSGAGDQGLIDNLFSPETSTADPEDVSAIEKNSDDGKGVDGKADVTALAGNEDNIPETTAKDPNALANFLLGGDDDGDDNDDENENKEEENILTTVDTTTAVINNNAGEEEEEGEGMIAFDSLANELADLGVFSRGEDEADGIKIDSPEDFLERFKQEKTNAANQMVSDFIGQFGPEHQEAFQAIYVNGANPREYFSQAGKVEDFSNLDLTQETNQEKVVRETLADQGFEEEDINAEIEKLKNYGDLEDVSKRHHKVLIKKEKAGLEQKALEAAQLQKAKQANKAQYIDNVRNVLQEKIKAKEFDGIPLNMNTANELQDFLLVDKWKTDSGETLTDFDKAVLDLKKPENHEQKVKIALLFKLLEKDPTLSTIQKRGVSKKSSELFKTVARQKTTANRAGGTKQSVKSWFEK